MTPVVRAGLVSLGVNIILIGIKSAAAWLSGSISVASDAVHSASDAVVSVLVILNCAWSEKHRGRGAAYINASFVIFVAMAIIAAGVEIFYKALTIPTNVTHVPTVLIAVLITIIGAELLARYKIRVGNQYNAPSLTADGYHSRADSWSSVGVFIAVSGQAVGIPLDRPVGVIIALLLFGIAIELIASAIIGIKQQKIPDPKAVDDYVRHKISIIINWLWAPINRYKKWIMIVGALVGMGLWIGLSSRIVRPGQAGFRLVMGRPVVNNHGPGMMLGLEPLIRVRVVDSARVRRVEVGYRTFKPLISNSGPRLWGSKHHVPGYQRTPLESLNLSGDGNIVDYAMVIHYTVRDPVLFISSISDPDTMVRSAVRALSAKLTASLDINSNLVADRAKNTIILRKRLQALLDQWKPVFHIQSVYIHDLHPPVAVVASFRDVFSAQEDVAVSINQAQAYSNDAGPKAVGRSYAAVVHAKAKAMERLESTQGRTSAFMRQALIFMQNRTAVTFSRYMDSLPTALTGGKFIVSGKGVPPIRYMDRGKR